MERRDQVSRRQHLQALVILAALVLIAYANSFSTGFPRDNRLVILENQRVHSVTRQHLKEILVHGYLWPEFDSGLYRPLSTLSYLFNYAVLGNSDQPAGYHGVNYLLHVANAFLVYLVALVLVRRYGPALFAAALWALHPICTEVVTDIVGRPEELAAIGVLAALLLYVRGSGPSGWRNALRLAAMMAAAVVAVFSKEGGVMVLPLAGLYDIAYRRRPDWKGYVCLGLPVLAMLCVRWAVLRHDGAMEIPFVNNPLSAAGFLVGRVTAIVVIGKYLWLLLWPQTLSCDYSYNQIPLFQWDSMNWPQWISLAAVAALLWLAAICYRRSRTGFFLLGFSALALLPAANLMVITGTIMAERLLYLPAVGFAAAVSFGIDGLVRRLGLRPIVAVVTLGAAGVAYGARTYRRNPDWQDEETLYTSAAEAVPADFQPQMVLAQLWYLQDSAFLGGDRAIAAAEKALAIVSGLPDDRIPSAALLVLGRLYRARGDTVAAKDAIGEPHSDAASAGWYHQALEVDLRAVSANRAFDADHRRRELARGTPADAINLTGFPNIYAELGRVYLRLGDPQQALQAFLYERRLAPQSSQAYLDIASAHQALDHTGEAVTAMLEAYSLDKSQSTLNALSKAYWKVDSGGCAVVSQAGVQALNQDCAAVKRDLCRAYRDQEAVFHDAKRQDLAELAREAGRHVPGCQ
jgi:tetratricopeptide (TPR) repeat protein